MRYKITLSYNGASFCGWQRQRGAPSVQETLENALSTLLGQPVQVTGAGRTDTGVSAIDYVAHFDVGEVLDADYIACKLNAILPAQTAVSELVPAAEGFHARFDAKSRSYTYFLHRCKNPFLADRSYFYAYPGLDFDLMNRAAALLTGTHDFSCFQKTGSDAKTSICTVSEAFWMQYSPTLSPGSPLPGCNYWYFRITADRFLRNMVRAIVGTLLEVGRGKRSLEDFAALILPEDGGTPAPSGSRRSLAGESVPGHALFLTEIKY